MNCKTHTYQPTSYSQFLLLLLQKTTPVNLTSLTCVPYLVTHLTPDPQNIPKQNRQKK